MGTREPEHPRPSSEKAARHDAAREGKEAARPVGIPPNTPAAPPLGGRRARRHLNRLVRTLRQHGWSTERMYDKPVPMLRVFSAQVPFLGESVKVASAPSEEGFISSTGEWLAPCSDPETAAERVTELLTPWVAVALTPREEP